MNITVQKKTFTNAEILNITEWYNANRNNVETRRKFDCLPARVQLGLKRNIETLSPILKPFIELRDDMQKELQDEFFGEEKSDEIIQTVYDNTGNPILDADGNEQTQPARQVKPEYLKEYQERAEELNNKIYEMLIERNDMELKVFNMDDILDSIPDDSQLNIDDFEMLYIMDINKEEEKSNGADE